MLPEAQIQEPGIISPAVQLLLLQIFSLVFQNVRNATNDSTTNTGVLNTWLHLINQRHEESDMIQKIFNRTEDYHNVATEVIPEISKVIESFQQEMKNYQQESTKEHTNLLQGMEFLSKGLKSDINQTNSYLLNNMLNLQKNFTSLQEKLQDMYTNLTSNSQTSKTEGKCRDTVTNWNLENKFKEEFRNFSESDKHHLFRRAVYEGNSAKLSALVQLGINVSKVFYRDKSPLRLAVDMNHCDIVRILLEAGANVNYKHIHLQGQSVIHRVGYTGNIQILHMLLNKGANLEETDEDGNTVLIIAAEFSSLEMVKELVKLGANLDVTNKRGNKALQHAKYFNTKDVSDWMIEQYPGRD
ncbi:uncharacterized protein [Periplaneta americana]|uniref:uncharacterized protein n=1 Tax=Periplaneta americana TaxID=6978 RepID=UPI0037E81DE9